MSDNEVAAAAWIVLLTCFVVAIVLTIRSDRNLLSPGTIVTTLLGLYTVMLPGRYVLFGQLPEDAPFRLDVFLQYCFICLIALVGFSSAYHWRVLLRHRPPRTVATLSATRVRVGAAILLAFGMVLIAILVQQLGGLGSYLQFGYGQEIYLALQGKGELQYGFHLAAFGLMALAFADYLQGRSWPWTSLIVAFPLILLYLLNGDRGSILRLGLAYTILHYLVRGRRPGIRFAVAAVLGALFLVIMGHVRGQPGIQPKVEFALQNIQWEWLNIFTVVGEFQMPAFALWRLLETPDLTFQLGLSYLNSIPYLIPQQLYPGRPTTLADQYLELYDPTFQAQGGGLGLLSVAEAYWNFGIIGPLFVFAVLGWFFRRMYDWTMTGLPSRALIYAALMSGAVLFVRIDFESALKASLYYVVPAVILTEFASSFAPRVSDNLRLEAKGPQSTLR